MGIVADFKRDEQHDENDHYPVVVIPPLQETETILEQRYTLLEEATCIAIIAS